MCVQVCAFAQESDPDMKGKVLIRLSNITDMQSQLEVCMNGEPRSLCVGIVQMELHINYTLCCFNYTNLLSCLSRCPWVLASQCSGSP